MSAHYLIPVVFGQVGNIFHSLFANVLVDGSLYTLGWDQGSNLYKLQAY